MRCSTKLEDSDRKKLVANLGGDQYHGGNYPRQLVVDPLPVGRRPGPEPERTGPVAPLRRDEGEPLARLRYLVAGSGPSYHACRGPAVSGIARRYFDNLRMTVVWRRTARIGQD
jgi:hypothetical protein